MTILIEKERERDQKMDTEIPELGSGTEPVDCPVWGVSHPVSVKGKSWYVALKKRSSITLFC